MTLHARIKWILLCTIVPLGVIVALGLYLFVSVTLAAKLDGELVTRSETLTAAIEIKSGNVVFDFDEGNLSQYQISNSKNIQQSAYFEIWQFDNGRPALLLERSPSLGADELFVTNHPPPLDGFWDGELTGDVDIRLFSTRVNLETKGQNEDSQSRGLHPSETTDPNHPTVLLIVAVPRMSVDGPLDTLIMGMICAGLVFAIVSGIAVRWSLEKGLAPVHVLSDSVAAIDASNLTTRLNVRHLPIEIAPIQGRINDLLGRIESSLQREKRFSVAVAHELRTPVAELRALLEVAASRPRSVEESHQTMMTALKSIVRLDRLVSALLRLTRIEGGREYATATEIPIGEFVREAIAQVQPMAIVRGIRFNIKSNDDEKIVADPDLIVMALSNLISNAAEYADKNSIVEIEITQQDSFIVMRMGNAASSLADVDIERLGESLWRIDSARMYSSHLGMGISLARSALEASDAGFTIHLDKSGVVQFRVEIQFTHAC